MKKFKVEAERLDEYEIEIDETVWTEKEIYVWASSFFPTDNVEDLVEHVAASLVRNDLGEFIEGFGILKCFYANGEQKNVWSQKTGTWMTDEEYCPGITVRIISHDDEFNYNIEEKK